MGGEKLHQTKHGLDRVYKAGCRCQSCTEAHRVYERNMARERRREKMGIEARPTRMVDAINARIHIKFLTENRISLRRIAQKSGVAVSELLRIKNGQVKSILVSTNNRIIAVPALDPDPHRGVPSDEAKRIVEDLIDVGFKKTEIAQMLGVRPGGHLVIKETIQYGRLQRLRDIHRSIPELRKP